MLTQRNAVHFKKPTSDLELKVILERISLTLNAVLTIHSGDRDFRPKGSPQKSLHLSHRAVDIHAAGMSDDALFKAIKNAKDNIFASVLNSYQVIHHGKYTATEAEHVHIGHYPLIKSYVTGGGVTFLVEGMSPAEKGQYTAISNIMKTKHDTVKNSISNIR